MARSISKFVKFIDECSLLNTCEMEYITALFWVNESGVQELRRKSVHAAPLPGVLTRQASLLPWVVPSMQRKFCHVKPPWPIVAFSTACMLCCHAEFMLAISCGDRLAQRPAPVPRGEHGKASSDGRLDHRSSKKTAKGSGRQQLLAHSATVPRKADRVYHM